MSTKKTCVHPHCQQPTILAQHGFLCAKHYDELDKKDPKCIRDGWEGGDYISKDHFKSTDVRLI